MKSQFLKSLAIAAFGLTLLATLVCTPQASAQQFSDWSAPVNLGPLVNSAGDDTRPAISRDGLSLYFSSTKPGGFGGPDLYVSQRASLDDPWGPPVNLGPGINTSGNDTAPNLSNDGHYLFFHRPGACGGLDLHFSHRKNHRDDLGWEPAINLDLFGREAGGPVVCIVNSPVNDAGPNYFQDETTGAVALYFTSLNRPGNIGDWDIYVTTLGPDGTFGPPLLDLNLNSPFRDTRTAIRRRDGLEMILSTERPGGVDLRDLWVSTRATTQDLWSLPVPLGPVVNSTASDGGPALSWDATELYFASTRPGGFGGTDLYVAKRTKLTGSQP